MHLSGKLVPRLDHPSPKGVRPPVDHRLDRRPRVSPATGGRRRTNGRGLYSPGAENFSFHFTRIHVHGSSCLVTLRCALPHGNRSLLVVCASGVHPVPSRTRSLSLTAPMVLGGTPPGRVGHRQRYCCFIRSRVSACTPGRPPTQAIATRAAGV